MSVQAYIAIVCLYGGWAGVMGASFPPFGAFVAVSRIVVLAEGTSESVAADVALLVGSTVGALARCGWLLDVLALARERVRDHRRNRKMPRATLVRRKD
jgi:hypothetical protein